MKILNIYHEGTLGDAYVVVLKLMRISKDYDLVSLFHKTQHHYWYKEIKDIYSLFSKIRLTFVEEKPYNSILEISSPDRHIKTEWFPNLQIKSEIKIKEPYVIVQPHSGKPDGGNTKKLHPKSIQQLVYRFGNVVLLGTDDLYKDIKVGHNLIGKTSILDAIALTTKATSFIGPEGLLSFVAISHKVNSLIFYNSPVAVNSRIEGTPWRQYCNLQRIS